MTELEKLKAQLNQTVDAIIAEVKKQNSATVSLSAAYTPPVVEKPDLLSHISVNFDKLIKDNKEKNLLTPYVNPYNWPRNNNCWARSLDLTGYAACIVPLGGVGGGTLITKKHVLFANHVPYAATPFMIFFINNNNSTIVYNVVKTKRVSNTDILIGELDREADASLKVYNILSANYLKYFDKNPSFPILHSDQERKALIANYGTIENIDNSTCVTIMPPTTTNKLAYYEQVIGGDSGNPVFTIINNEAVLLGGWYKQWYNGGGLATLLSSYISDINSTIASLTPNYKVNEYDLSSFKQY